MRAYILPGPEARPMLADVAVPEVADGEVLVRVTTSSVNPHDASVASGAAARYMTYRYPVVLGSDLAGTVERVGAGVGDLSPDQRVFGLVRERIAGRGSFAELVAVPREWVVPIPTGVDDTSAGALGLAAVTAWHCVTAVDPRPGETVLVNGATGGVGSYAIQLLAARGASVIATARLGEEESHVRSLGAIDALDWTAGDLAETVRARHPARVDAIIDLVNRDKNTFAALATRILGPGGRVACTGHAADPDSLLGISAVNVLADVDQVALNGLADLTDAGRLRAPITHTYTLDEIDKAFAALSAGAMGKLAVQI
jgi:NADPH:quinone reductase-like Zn-dependent oxidoreductase